jgi:PAS domain S-box-containing protein
LKKTKKPVVVEHIHYDREGNPIAVEVYGYPIFDRRGDVAQMIEYCLDVTERKLAEQALRESEEKFRGLAEQSPNMIFINRKGRVVYANRRCEEIMGYRREEFYSPDFDFLEMVAPECRDLVKENFSKHRRGEEVHPYEYTLRTKDGKKIEAILNSRLITYGGEPAILGIVTDITERKHVEQELRKRSYDLGERIKELNCLYLISNLVERPGISLEDMLHGTANLIPGAWEYPDITCARIILEDKVFLTSNFRETSWNQSTEIAIHGNPVGSVEVGYLEERPEKDEGPFLAEERSLLKAIAERLGRVVERTRAREEIQKLNASLKAQAHELAAANKELEAFSYSVSHDLRAPLRTVEGFSQALLEDYADKIDPNGKDYLQRVRSATRRMGQLIDDLLNLSLTTRREMRREETNLSELARTIAGELAKTRPDRQAEFIIQDRVRAHGDTSLLRELLENLLGNAWKFTGKTPGAKIEFGAEVQGDQEVYFVRDNGAGFEMKYADKLFVPFQRLHSDSEFSGNGIGLALVSRIVNRHGGRIWAEGEMEKGATFYFTLQ